MRSYFTRKKKKMKKHNQYLIVILVIIFVYNAIYLALRIQAVEELYQSRLMNISERISIQQLRFWLDVLPWYSLICFGCYCLSRLGIDILRFNDCPKEIEKMTQVIIPLVAEFLTSL